MGNSSSNLVVGGVVVTLPNHLGRDKHGDSYRDITSMLNLGIFGLIDINIIEYIQCFTRKNIQV